MKMGLRTEKKRPDNMAFDGQFVKQGPSRGDGYNASVSTSKWADRRLSERKATIICRRIAGEHLEIVCEEKDEQSTVLKL